MSSIVDQNVVMWHIPVLDKVGSPYKLTDVSWGENVLRAEVEKSCLPIYINHICQNACLGLLMKLPVSQDGHCTDTTSVRCNITSADGMTPTGTPVSVPGLLGRCQL